MEATKAIASVEVQNTGDTYTSQVIIGKHRLIVDEPVEVGGHDLGPAPGDYLCVALASCKAITLRMYALRKNWAVGEIRVKVSLVKDNEDASGLNTFYCSVHFTGSLREEQLQRLLDISKKCPIDRMLKKPSDVVTVIE